MIRYPWIPLYLKAEYVHYVILFWNQGSHMMPPGEGGESTSKNYDSHDGVTCSLLYHRYPTRDGIRLFSALKLNIMNSSESTNAYS